MTRRARQLLLTAGLALGLAVALPGTPAFADPAGPTDYRSEVDAIEPAPAGIDVEVVGSDSFLRVAAEPGHSVVVVGYWDEPYARINEDGTVEINQASPSVPQNTSRYGVATDGTIDASLPPRWEATGDEGELVWHDHRSHWMATTKATVSGPDGLVQRWELPLVVDGTDVVVRGSLYRHASPSIVWWALALPFAVVAALVARARAPMVAVLGGVIAVGGLIDRLSLPSDARPAWAAVALGAIASAAGIAALLGRRTWWSSAILAGGGAALAVAGYVQRTAVTRAFVPGPTPDWLVRLATVGAVATGIVVFVTALLVTVGIRFDLLIGSGPRPVSSDA